MESLISNKRPRSPKNTDKSNEDLYSSTQKLLLELSKCLNSIQLDNLRESDYNTLILYKSQILQNKFYKKYLKTLDISVKEEENLKISHTFGNQFTEIEIIGLFSIFILKLINHILQKKDLSVNFAKLVKDLKKEKKFNFINQANPLSCIQIDLLLSGLQIPQLSQIETSKNELQCESYLTKDDEIPEDEYISFLSFGNDYTPIFDENNEYDIKPDKINFRNKNDILFVLTSKPVIEAYLKMLETQNINTSEEQIKTQINAYLSDTSKFFLITMPIGIYGLTIYNGMIFCNKRYLNKEHPFPFELKQALMVIAFIHEMAHVLVRTMRSNMNYYLNTDNCIVNGGKNDEAGLIVENLLFIVVDNLNVCHCRYVLDKKNYHKSLDLYQKGFSYRHYEGIHLQMYKLRQSQGPTLYYIGRCGFQNRP